MILVILTFILLTCLFAKPSIDRTPFQSDVYLSHERTCCINGVFIWLVFVCHLNHYPTTFLGVEQRINAEICQLGQLVVTTFFTYTGYGLMSSLKRKGSDYARSLLFHRFPRVLITFGCMVLLYWLIETMMGRHYSLAHVLISLTGFRTLENSGWFIFITLLAYIEIAVSYLLFHKWGNTVVVLIVTLVMCSFMPFFESSVMNDTVLCVPAGMFLCIYKDQLQSIISRIPVHISLFAVPVALIGRYLFYGNNILLSGYILPPTNSEASVLSPLLYYMTDNIGAVLFALGITWLAAGIRFKTKPSFLVWSGGPALFFLYILQRIPMMLGVHFGLHLSHPFIFNIMCMLATIALAWTFLRLFSFLESLISHTMREKSANA